MIERKTLGNGSGSRKPVDMQKVYTALDSGRSVGNVAAEWGVSPSTLYRRHREYQAEQKQTALQEEDDWEFPPLPLEDGKYKL